MNSIYDIFIIGGGINGAGIARDASGRNLKVGLAEMNKVGQATSSWSTKLIHGGVRYLENYDFKIVKESLKERNIIYNIASSISNPLPFIIPHTTEHRSAWLIRMGLFAYDILSGKSSIPKSSSLNIYKNYPNILKEKYRKGFKYYDIQINDQRLVELNIEDAKKRGATIYENSKVIKTTRTKDLWKIFLENNRSIESKILINASGPWVMDVMSKILNIKAPKSLRLVKGSHIITKKLYEEKIAFTLQNRDKRIIFLIPYKKNYTLIGTTEIEVDSPDNPKISDYEINYLIDGVNDYLKKQISKNDIQETFSGIRPLIENFKYKSSKLSRDYSFDLNTDKNQAPVLNIFGGKLTTYRKLSEKALSDLNIYFPELKKSWTSDKSF